MKITIPGKLPSLNEMINASKRSKYQYMKLKNGAISRVAWEARLALKHEMFHPYQCDYEITWYCPDKRTDKDNIMAGQKYIFDGLQDMGFLTNDGWKQIRNVTHRFEVDKDNPRVEVEIMEVSA